MSEQPASVENTISDEALRVRIRKLIEEPRTNSIWQNITRNPLTGTLLGFILGITGTLLSNHFRAEEVRQQQERERVIAGSVLVREVATLMYERRTNASLLYSSLKRNADLRELAERKAAYDKSYAEWNVQPQAKSLALRSLTNSPEYTELESYIQYGLTPHLGAIDTSLTSAYDWKRSHPHDPITLDREKLDFQFHEALNCAYVISQTLLVTLASDTRVASVAAKRAVWEELEVRCPKQ